MGGRPNGPGTRNRPEAGADPPPAPPPPPPTPPWTKPLTNCGDNSPASTVEPSNRPSRSGPISSRPCPTGNDAPAPNATPTPWSPSPTTPSTEPQPSGPHPQFRWG